MGEVAAEAVELPDHEHVALPQGSQAAVESRPVVPGSWSSLRWADVADAADGTASFVTVRRGKTNQEGETRGRAVREGRRRPRAIRTLRAAASAAPALATLLRDRSRPADLARLERGRRLRRAGRPAAYAVNS